MNHNIKWSINEKWSAYELIGALTETYSEDDYVEESGDNKNHNMDIYRPKTMEKWLVDVKNVKHIFREKDIPALWIKRFRFYLQFTWKDDTQTIIIYHRSCWGSKIEQLFYRYRSNPETYHTYGAED